MLKKISRNDLCYCGSGKKYKKCCLQKEEEQKTVVEFLYPRFRRMEWEITDKYLLDYADKIDCFPSPYDIWDDVFCDGLPQEIDKDLVFTEFFMWFSLLDWTSSKKTSDTRGFKADKTIAMNYLESHRHDLSNDEIEFIQQIDNSYYSFYKILRIQEDNLIIVKDLLLGCSHNIIDKLGADSLVEGNIIYARFITMQEISMFVGIMPYVLHQENELRIIGVRESLKKEYKKITSEILSSLKYVLLDLFLVIFQSNITVPRLNNTDGEEMVFITSYFELSNATVEEVYLALLPMTLSKDKKDFMDEAKKDKRGNLVEIEIPWLKGKNKVHKHWDNTVLGHIKIEKKRIVLDVNSNERMEKGRKEIEKYLGDKIVYKNSVIESQEQLMLRKAHEDDKHEETILESPESQEYIDDFIKKHWNNWLTEKLPVLDDQTPREASKTELGREKLEALLSSYEERNTNSPSSIDFYSEDNMKKIRKRLKL